MQELGFGRFLNRKQMMHNMCNVDPYIQWKLNSRNFSFRQDNQTRKGHLGKFSSSSHKFDNKKVAEFWVKGQWNYKILVQQAPSSKMDTILAMPVPRHQISNKDYWIVNSIGKFTCSSNWNEISDKRPKDQFKALIQHKHTPFKASFLLCKSSNGKLLTNEKLTNFVLEHSSCFCCRKRAGSNTINHIFNNTEFATEVRRCFANRAGVEVDPSSLRQLITQWQSMKRKNEAHKLIYRLPQ